MPTVEELLINKNIKPLYLPSYTPELNPVEKMFNITRQHVEKGRPRIKDKLISLIEEKMEFFHKEDLTRYLDNSLKECLAKLSLTKNTEFSDCKVDIDEFENGLEKIVDTRELAQSTLNRLSNLEYKINL